MCKRYEAYTKLFTEFLNMANLANFWENLLHNPAKWSFNSVKISNLNKNFACKTNSPVDQSFLFLLKWKLKEQLAKNQPEIILCAQDFRKTECFLAQRNSSDVEMFCWIALGAFAIEIFGCKKSMFKVIFSSHIDFQKPQCLDGESANQAYILCTIWSFGVFISILNH